MKKRFTIIILSSTVLLAVIMIFLGDSINKKNFIKFYNSKIEGKIMEVNKHKGATDFAVGNQEFTFVPSYVNNDTDFPYFAKKGDSVYKPAKADTLKLIHNGKIFLYTFKKF
ncbi:MAG: hypothetical protein JWQ57_231 [Mucilaginibacter sp.]|nr:hypothetical protein [Mucilaginibacter sp.]